nr:light-inducible DNA recombinase RecV [synthetic construct]
MATSDEVRKNLMDMFRDRQAFSEHTWKMLLSVCRSWAAWCKLNGTHTLYAPGGYDIMGYLIQIMKRPNPQVELGPVDTSVALILCDLKQKDTPIVYASEAFLYMTGYSNAEVLGRNCRFLQSPDGMVKPKSTRKYVDSNTINTMRKAIDRNAEVQVEVVNFKKNGQRFVNFLTMIPVRDETGEYRYSMGFQCETEGGSGGVPKKKRKVGSGSGATNFSLLKQAGDVEENPGPLEVPKKKRKVGGHTLYAPGGYDIMGYLIQIMKRPNPQVELGPVDTSVALILCDLKQKDTPIVYASEAFLYMTGYSNAEVLGRNCRFLQSPDGMVKPKSTRKYVDSNTINTMRKAIDRNAEVQVEVVNFKKNGQRFVNFLTMIPVRDETGEYRYSMGFQCETEGTNRKWFPAEPEDVRDYLLYLQARGLAVKTIQQHLGQLNMLHRRSGLPRPSDSNAVSLVMRRIRKENVDAGERAKQALAFERTDFDQVRSLMENSDRCQDIRNLAFLGIAYNTLLRIAEIARIRVKDISRTDGGRMLIHIGRTKTLVSTAGVEKALSLGVTKLVERWISVSGVADDPNNYLFCRVRKNGVAAPSATSQLSTRALEGIFEATHRLIYGAKDDSGQRYLAWSGHSARVGAARDMARAGVSIPEIMQAGGWTNVNIVMNYIRNLDSETGAMVRLLEDGD